MRVFLSSMVALAAVVAAAALPTPTLAASHPRVEAGDCNALAAKLGAGNVWRTYFQGSRQGLFQREYDNESPCFRTQLQCTQWLYWAQSDWPQMNSFVPCRRGV